MAVVDPFDGRVAGLDSPAEAAAVVAPNDAADLPTAARGISFAKAGDLRLTLKCGKEVVIPDGALAAGVIHKLRVLKVWAKGTTAKNVVVYW